MLQRTKYTFGKKNVICKSESNPPQNYADLYSEIIPLDSVEKLSMLIPQLCIILNCTNYDYIYLKMSFYVMSQSSIYYSSISCNTVMFLFT